MDISAIGPKTVRSYFVGMPNGIEMMGHNPFLERFHPTPGISCYPFHVPVSLHALQEILRVNVLGSVYTTQALLPAMITKRQGKIVFISSQLGQVKSNACLSFVHFTSSCCSLVSVRSQLTVLPSLHSEDWPSLFKWKWRRTILGSASPSPQ